MTQIRWGGKWVHLAYIWIVSHLCAKNYRNWWKFDEVLTKTNLLSFFFGTWCTITTTTTTTTTHTTTSSSSSTTTTTTTTTTIYLSIYYYFLPSYFIPRVLKLANVKRYIRNGYDGDSGTVNVLARHTALKRCIATDIRWYVESRMIKQAVPKASPHCEGQMQPEM